MMEIVSLLAVVAAWDVLRRFSLAVRSQKRVVAFEQQLAEFDRKMAVFAQEADKVVESQRRLGDQVQHVEDRLESAVLVSKESLGF